MASKEETFTCEQTCTTILSSQHALKPSTMGSAKDLKLDGLKTLWGHLA